MTTKREAVAVYAAHGYACDSVGVYAAYTAPSMAQRRRRVTGSTHPLHDSILPWSITRRAACAAWIQIAQTSLGHRRRCTPCGHTRNSFCVKEISTLEREDCGRTDYFGDKWNAQ